jgi:two-component system, cell cycle sensor histidine kinase and response regulator CckA
VASALGNGKRVEILFPATTSEAPVAQPAVLKFLSSGQGECILVAEDEDAVRDVVRRILTRSGYRVLAAHNAVEAIALFEGAEKVDLLLSDVIMPGLSGKELADALLRLDPSLRTVMMSGYTDDLLGIAELDGRDESFLQKPFSAEELLAVVQSRLAVSLTPVSPASS